MKEDFYNLLESLTETISDYQNGTISKSHVHKWLNQFDYYDRYTILSEMNFIMRKFYYSRDRVKRCVRNFVKNTLIGDKDPNQYLPQVRFLNIQKNGDSQKAMLAIVNEVLREEYNISLAITGKDRIKTYVYIDDAIYTGNKIFHDLIDDQSTTNWLSENRTSDCMLLIYAIAIHESGYNYVRKTIKDIISSKNVKIRAKYDLFIQDDRINSKDIEVLWPEELLSDLAVQSYITEFNLSIDWSNSWSPLFCPTRSASSKTIFSSLEARRTIEKAFLLKGIDLINRSQSHAKSIRPLGYMPLRSLGFGTLFITYRNIANNCPLVLWWGDPQQPDWHPLSKWYPLFPRKVNMQHGIM